MRFIFFSKVISFCWLNLIFHITLATEKIGGDLPLLPEISQAKNDSESLPSLPKLLDQQVIVSDLPSTVKEGKNPLETPTLENGSAKIEYKDPDLVNTQTDLNTSHQETKSDKNNVIRAKNLRSDEINNNDTLEIDLGEHKLPSVDKSVTDDLAESVKIKNIELPTINPSPVATHDSNIEQHLESSENFDQAKTASDIITSSLTSDSSQNTSIDIIALNNEINNYLNFGVSNILEYISPLMPVIMSTPSDVATPSLTVATAVTKNDVQKYIATAQHANNSLPINTTDAFAIEDTEFFKDELTMFLLVDDEVVLGKVSPNAQLENLEDKAYINLFRNSFAEMLELPKDIATRNTINNIKNLDKPQELLFDNSELEHVIIQNDFDTLKVFFDHSNKITISDKTPEILSKTVISDSYDLMYYLIMKKVNLNMLDKYGATALHIARQEDARSILWLLRKAGAKDYTQY